MPGRVSDVVTKAIYDAVLALGIEVADVEYVKKPNGMNLTIFIAKPDATPITIDDCEKVHRTIDPILDDIDPTNGAGYILNVSSLGLDRPFKNTKDFLRYVNKSIEVKLYTPIDKTKLFIGQLIRADDDDIELLCNDKTITISRKAIALAQPHITF